ncbi:cytochrome b [Atopomonas sediminilitoris]|uniref:cytochrome b n=1 Tax=Atopomonas sediminilitoris TaxID=2919919 RepID=UPI001F4DAA92|nr:cytochrome b [Atopomonas sediminilitoris]MCJ8169599.1 cytochrome b [Atopomonas sediminilitoris]
MSLKNQDDRYGWLSITLHWLVALVVIGMFAWGLWMMDLGYYDPWRKDAPELHKSVGICLLVLMLLRLSWRLLSPQPKPLAGHSALVRVAAKAGHGALYLVLFALMASGYLISTADGRAIEVFGVFSVPALISGLPEQEDIAGWVHELLAWGLIGLVVLHAAAALKHHFIDRDATLRRMLGGRGE